MTRVFRPGVFDQMHIGHVNCILHAASLGTHLIIGVQDDRDVVAGKGKTPVNPLPVRMAKVSAIKGVNEVLSYRDSDISSLLDVLKINVLAVGEDYGHDPQFPKQEVTVRYCQSNGIRIDRYPRTDKVPDDYLESLCKDSQQFWDNLSDVPYGTMLTSFSGDCYAAQKETEREVELMRKYVQSTDTILDIGCGTGRLAVDLAPHCLYVYGLDFAPSSIDVFNARGITNMTGRVADVSSLEFGWHADVIILSGITPCLNDTTYSHLLQFCDRKLSHGGRVLVRSSVATENRIDVINQFSTQLKQLYTAFYRCPKTMIADMARYSFDCVESIRLYANHPDTHVRFMAFKKTP